MMLTVCMIVKNEAAKLKLTLPQLVKHAAEVIIVDTGSTDDTVAVAKELGARVEHFNWVDDFSAARNYSLSFAAEPWIAWLDADEYLQEEDLIKLDAALKGAAPDQRAFDIIMTEAPFGQTVRGKSYLRTKVFRNRLGIHFVRPINEQTVDAEGKTLNGTALPVVIYHWGRNLQADEMAVKRERYLRLYNNHLQTNPDDPYVNYLLGNLLKESGCAAEALDAFSRAAENSQQDRSINVLALTGKTETELKLGKLKEAFQTALKIRELDPSNPASVNIIATILIAAGQIAPAIQGLEDLLKSPAGIDPIREQIMPRVILADAYRKLGQPSRAGTYEAEARQLKGKYHAGT
jgi:glycosyltransferase involved in cell wall biosynthesis